MSGDLLRDENNRVICVGKSLFARVYIHIRVPLACRARVRAHYIKKIIVTVAGARAPVQLVAERLGYIDVMLDVAK